MKLGIPTLNDAVYFIVKIPVRQDQRFFQNIWYQSVGMGGFSCRKSCKLCIQHRLRAAFLGQPREDWGGGRVLSPLALSFRG